MGGPVVRSVRGGRGHGSTRLTPLGDRIVRDGFDSVELLDPRPAGPATRSNVLSGVYHRRPFPEVDLGRGLKIGWPSTRRRKSPSRCSSAPNRSSWRRAGSPPAPGTCSGRRSTRWCEARGRSVPPWWPASGSGAFRIGVTEESVRQLRLVRGARVWLYVKATAVRRRGALPGLLLADSLGRERIHRLPLGKVRGIDQPGDPLGGLRFPQIEAVRGRMGHDVPADRTGRDRRTGCRGGPTPGSSPRRRRCTCRRTSGARGDAC